MYIKKIIHLQASVHVSPIQQSDWSEFTSHGTRNAIEQALALCVASMLVMWLIIVDNESHYNYSFTVYTNAWFC